MGARSRSRCFRRDDVPISIGLVIDNSGSMRSLRASVEAAALAFVRASNPLDQVFVVYFADTPRIDVPFTNDIGVLEAGVTRVDAIGGTAVRDAISDAERYLREHASHDRALLVITDGNDNASSVSMAQLHRVAEQSDAAIFGVGLVRETASAEERRGEDELDRLAEVTGGSLLPSGSGDTSSIRPRIASRALAGLPSFERKQLDLIATAETPFLIASTSLRISRSTFAASVRACDAPRRCYQWLAAATPRAARRSDRRALRGAPARSTRRARPAGPARARQSG